MTANRHRSALVWLAVAAMAVVSLARVEAGAANASVYSNPVLAFLAGQQNGAASVVGGSQAVHLGSARQSSRAAAPGAWMAVLPVLFVGLVAPLNLISPQALLCLGRTSLFPDLCERFQRPPPALR